MNIHLLKKRKKKKHKRKRGKTEERGKREQGKKNDFITKGLFNFLIKAYV